MAPEKYVGLHLFSSHDSRHATDYAQDMGWVVNHMNTGKHLFALQTSACDVVNKALTTVEIGQKIMIMRILAHGNSGQLLFPWLLDTSSISLEYQRFQYFFDPLARLEVHGCGVASDTPIPKSNGVGKFAGYTSGNGLKYLRKMAQVFGVKVVAGIDEQYTHRNNWGYDGDTVTVFPNGSFHLDSAVGREYDLQGQQRAASNWLTEIDKEISKGGQLNRCRNSLQELIRMYPKTLAAKWAADRLRQPNLLSTTSFYADP